MVKGIFDPPTGGLAVRLGDDLRGVTFDRHVDSPAEPLLVRADEGRPDDANAAALDKTLKEFPNAKAATREKFIDNQISGLSSCSTSSTSCSPSRSSSASSGS